MIIRGKSRAGAAGLAKHLSNAEKNERISVLETRGTVAQDLRGSLQEMEAYAAGTRCDRPLYHAAISPGMQYRLSPEQINESVNALEQKLGFDGHARVVVMHEKYGRQHFHVVWSRIDLDQMRAVPDSHNFRKHEEVSRDLEKRYGHERVQGAHHERDGVTRPERTPSLDELRQDARTGIKGSKIKEEVTELFRTSDNAQAFVAALGNKGYTLAQGDRRDFVIVDREAGVHSLARRIDGLKAAQLKEFMSPIDRDHLPGVAQARDAALQKKIENDELERERARDMLEKSYASGGDYVTQSQAAQRDFEQRQRKLDREQDTIRLFNFETMRAEAREKAREEAVQQRQRSEEPGKEQRPGERGDASREGIVSDAARAEARARAREEAELLRRQAEETTKRDEVRDQFAQGKPRSVSEVKSDGIEMSDARREKESRRTQANDEGRMIDDDPDRQRNAPGGGRTRSR